MTDKPKRHLPAKELHFLNEWNLLWRWAETASGSDEFWRRILSASSAYPKKQLAISRLVALCTEA